jgi:hypothetical protein
VRASIPGPRFGTNINQQLRGALAVIDDGMALVDGLQKAVADATRIHQIDTATQSLFEHFGQLN